MKRGLSIVLLSILFCFTLSGQDLDDYRYYKLYEDSTPESPIIESEVVAMPLPDFSFRYSLLEGVWAVANDRRAEPYYNRKAYIDGLYIPTTDISKAYSVGYLKRGVPATMYEHYAIDTTRREQTSIGVRLAMRNYTGSIYASSTNKLPKGWQLMTNMDIRTGRDALVDGVFSNELSLNAVAIKSDSLSTTSLSLFFNPYLKSQRKASTKEAFRLMGDNLYNPMWGYQDGRVRSAAVRGSIMPTLVASHKRKVTSNSTLSIAACITIGEQSYSALDWMGARSPMPDNYRRLPAYYGDEPIAKEIEKVWITGESRYTQINFDELYARNRLLKQAAFIMGQSVERRADVQISAAMRSCVSDNLAFDYGVRVEYRGDREFKRVEDMLGATTFADIDYFMVDDASYSSLTENDMNNAGRMVGKGDKYSYDYRLRTTSATAFAGVDFRKGNLEAAGQLSVGMVDMVREGMMRKELFADNSFGKSRQQNFTPASLHLSGRYIFAQKHLLEAAVLLSSEAPSIENLFLQTKYNNRVIESPRTALHYAAEVSYGLQMARLKLKATIFARYKSREVKVGHYFDDISSTFVDMVASDISTIAAGCEAEVAYNLTEQWRVSAAVHCGRYRYANNPHITLYADNDNRIIDNATESFVSGLPIGRTPEFSALAQIAYYNKGWSVRLEGEYHTGRYISPALPRRTARVLFAASSKEDREQMLDVERLKGCVTADLTVSKSFYLQRYDKRIYSTAAAPRFITKHPRARIYVMAVISNLLSNKDVVYHGYESSRMQKRYVGDSYTIKPHPSYYLYAYPGYGMLQIRFTF